MPCKTKKLHTSNIQWARVNVLIKNGRNRRIARKYWTEARLKPSREKYGLWRSMPGIPGMWWYNVLSNRLGHPSPYGLAIRRSHDLFWLVSLIACDFPQQNPMFLEFPT
jgi:hypothetical protein